ncbi:MAG: hypothetical protein ACON4Z_13950 [Planctomycetota bacterium]
MKLTLTSLSTALLAAWSLAPLALAQRATTSATTEAEVRQAVLDSFNRIRQTKQLDPSQAPEFSLNSNGSLLAYVPRGSITAQRFEHFNLTPSNIHVTTLVEGKAAVAMFYSQGEVQFAGAPMIQGYRTRCSQTWIKGDDGWVIKTAHYSPMTGGEGVATMPLQTSESRRAGGAPPIVHSARSALPSSEMSRAIEDRIDYVFRYWRSKQRGLAGANGLHVFNSNGGMLAHSSPVQVVEFPVSTVQPRDVHVVPLVDGEAAVAIFYAEGSLQVKGGPLVPNYRTRVTQTFVKEFGRWHCKTEHWSKLAGAEGVQPVRVAGQLAPEPVDQSGFSTDCKEIDAVMHSVRMFTDGNIDAWRACYTEDAQWTHNQWGATNPIDDLAAIHRAFHEGVESVVVTNYNFECVTYGNGVKKVNSWLKFRAKYKTGEVDERCGAFSVRLGEDNRFTYEVGLYDTAGMPGSSPYDDKTAASGAPADQPVAETNDPRSTRVKEAMMTFAKGDLSYADEFYKADARFVLPDAKEPLDVAGWRTLAGNMHEAFGDIEFTQLAMNTTTYPQFGSWTYAWCVWQGTSKATGEVHRFPLHLMWQWDGDRIAREFGYFDAARFTSVLEATLEKLGEE